MKSKKIFKNLPFDIDRLYDIQKYIYCSQDFFIKLEDKFKIFKFNDSNNPNIDLSDSEYIDYVVSSFVDLYIDYNKLKREINFIDFNKR